MCLWLGRHWETFVHNLYSNANLCVICILAPLSPALIHMPTFTEIGVIYSTESLKCNLMFSLAVRICLMSFVARIPRFVGDCIAKVYISERFDSRQGKEFFVLTASSPPLGPVRRMLGSCLSRGVLLTTHLHLTSKLRTHGTVSPLTNRCF